MKAHHTLPNHSAAQSSKPSHIDNLIKNGDFTEEFEHWTVNDFGDPENCQISGRYARLKNNASVVQSVEVERATPYTLRFSAGSLPDGAGIAQIVEDGVVTQSLYINAGTFKHNFVTRERTAAADVQFTGVGGNSFFVSYISLHKDTTDPEERVRNADFDFGNEDWEHSGNVEIYDGRCEIHTPASYARQPINGLVTGATYRISCTTLAMDTFVMGGVFLSIPTGKIEVITLKAGVHEYSYEYQVTDTPVVLYLQGFHVAYDSISIKRISV